MDRVDGNSEKMSVKSSAHFEALGRSLLCSRTVASSVKPMG